MAGHTNDGYESASFDTMALDFALASSSVVVAAALTVAAVAIDVWLWLSVLCKRIVMVCMIGNDMMGEPETVGKCQMRVRCAVFLLFRYLGELRSSNMGGN